MSDRLCIAINLLLCLARERSNSWSFRTCFAFHGAYASAASWEPTLRLTDAGGSLIGSLDVGMQRSPGGVGARRGAARCGDECGHCGGSRRRVMTKAEPRGLRSTQPFLSRSFCAAALLCTVLLVFGCRPRALVAWSAFPHVPADQRQRRRHESLTGDRTSRVPPSPKANQELVKVGNRRSSGHEQEVDCHAAYWTPSPNMFRGADGGGRWVHAGWARRLVHHQH